MGSIEELEIFYSLIDSERFRIEDRNKKDKAKSFNSVKKKFEKVLVEVKERRLRGNYFEYLEEGKVRGLKRSISDFHTFNVEKTLVHSDKLLLYENGRYLKIQSQSRCPLCEAEVSDLGNHVAEELRLEKSTTRILIDSGFGLKERVLNCSSKSVWDAKNIVYNSLGISVGKQKIFHEGRELKDKENVQGLVLNLIVKGRKKAHQAL